MPIVELINHVSLAGCVCSVKTDHLECEDLELLGRLVVLLLEQIWEDLCLSSDPSSNTGLRTFQVVMTVADCMENPFDRICGIPKLVLVENSSHREAHDLKITFEEEIEENEDVLMDNGKSARTCTPP